MKKILVFIFTMFAIIDIPNVNAENILTKNITIVENPNTQDTILFDAILLVVCSIVLIGAFLYIKNSKLLKENK